MSFKEQWKKRFHIFAPQDVESFYHGTISGSHFTLSNSFLEDPNYSIASRYLVTFIKGDVLPAAEGGSMIDAVFDFNFTYQLPALIAILWFIPFLTTLFIPDFFNCTKPVCEGIFWGMVIGIILLVIGIWYVKQEIARCKTFFAAVAGEGERQ